MEMINCEHFILLESLISIVRNASLLMSSDFDIDTKGSVSNIVTTNDRRVQDFLMTKLIELLPQSGFICEENDTSIIKKNTWIIDPIDGTTNYSRGIDDNAISVALKQNDSILIGVVYLPFKNKMFTAIRGEGAFLNGKRINVSNRSFEDSLFCTSWCAYNKTNLDVCSSIINEVFLQCNDIRRFGSAASELCYLAEGCCELYFEYELYPWDYAAASLILQEAGGFISGLKGNELDFACQTGIIAANDAGNIKKMRDIMAKHI